MNKYTVNEKAGESSEGNNQGAAIENNCDEKADLKLNIHKTKIKASGPMVSWQINAEKVETVADFVFLGSKSLWMVTAAMKLKDTCSLEGKL